ncbi:hypothetical protein P378_13225 [Desulforamulus profundi]|uniref:Uncharacterized protein n=1 Tax=Desulforamulus profundi TaxID=1383067 RepID=A0A2C6M9R7_9FIRM|nr:hypothetical protein [Desulforamulus profundi]PHJ37899.1 hypothetical protein P378_13225 [Desulforamulus profundi]
MKTNTVLLLLALVFTFLAAGCSSQPAKETATKPAGKTKEGQTIIKEFGVDKYGEPLFFPNSEEGKKL